MPDPKSVTHILRHHRQKSVVELFRKIDGMKLAEACGANQNGVSGGVVMIGDPNRLTTKIFIDFASASRHLQTLADEDAQLELSRIEGRAHTWSVLEDIEADSRIITASSGARN